MSGNECYSDLKEAMKKYTVDFKLAPLKMHWWNAAERVIITCKNHFISGLSTTDTDLPISEWDQLPSQCLITLNLLLNCIVNQAGKQRHRRTCDRQNPQGTTGTWVQAESGKRGRAPERKRRQTQANGAGCRDERWRLAGGGCGWRLGWRRFTPGEEFGSGWNYRSSTMNDCIWGGGRKGG